MKFIYIILILVNFFSLSSCLFKNSKNIKQLANVAELDEELNKSNLTIGMMLIYSTGCGHCHTFSKTYEQLAEKYNKSMLFFAMNVYSDYYKRMPSTSGVPYILFYADGNFYPHKRRRSFEEISNTIDNNYLTRCREISFQNIENVYYNIFMKKKNRYNNLIVGYFDENSENDIENFKTSNKLMCPECVGLCYICKDFNDNKNTNNTLLKYIKSNIIVGYLPNNNSKIFLWDKNYEPEIHKYYENFINIELKLDYYIIDNSHKLYLFNFLRNKNNLFFAYSTNEEKKIFEKNINELMNIADTKILSLFNLVLYNYNCFTSKDNSNYNNNTLEYIKTKGIYEINKELNVIGDNKDFEELKDKIIKEYDIFKKQKHGVNYNPLVPEGKNNDKDKENENPNNTGIYFDELFFKILEKICVVLFTVVVTFAMFFILYNKYYSKVDKELINIYVSNANRRNNNRIS